MGNMKHWLLFFLFLSIKSIHAHDFLVLLKPNATLEILSKQLDFIEPNNFEQLIPSMAIYHLKTLNTSSLKLQLEQLRNNQYVEIAQVNHTNLVNRSLPNDEDLQLQWYLYGTTQFSPEGGPAHISAAAAWEQTVGGRLKDSTKVVLAIVDDGFFPQHQDIQWFVNQQEIPNNNLDDDGNGYIDDVSGWNAYTSGGTMNIAYHGIHTAGLAGALGNNTNGITGICQQAELLPISGSSTNEATVIAAYGYAYTLRKQFNESAGNAGAFVVACNSSFGVDGGKPADYPLWCALFDSLGSVGILSVGATANANYNVDVVGDIPTSCPSPYLISVTSSNSFDNKVPNAAYGIQSIDIAAPGVGMYSTMPQNQYQAFSGTSTAAPIVTGAVGLMYSAGCSNFIDFVASNPAAVALQVKTYMLQSGVDSTADWATKVKSQGRINLEKCVAAMGNFNCTRLVTSLNSTACKICDGFIDATLSEGKEPLTFTWNTGSNSRVLQDLCEGEYSVTLTDALGNAVASTYTVLQNDILAVNSTISASCNEDSSGVSIAIKSDVNLVNIEWNRGKDLHAFENFDGPGMYSLYINALDTACYYSGVYEVVFVASIGVEGNQIVGGTPPYTVIFTDGTTTLSDTIFAGLPQQIQDAKGCRFYYVPSSVAEGVLSSTFSISPNPTTGFVKVNTFLVNNVDLQVFTLTGQQIMECTTCSEFDISNFANGVYMLKLNHEGIGSSWHKILLEK